VIDMTGPMTPQTPHSVSWCLVDDYGCGDMFEISLDALYAQIRLCCDALQTRRPIEDDVADQRGCSNIDGAS